MTSKAYELKNAYIGEYEPPKIEYSYDFRSKSTTALSNDAGTGTFIRGPIKDRGIPDDYTLVEYIESTATNPGTGTSSGQYIDTLYTHNPNTKIEIDLQFKETTVQQRLFGSETVSSSYSTFSAYINGSGQWARATKDGEGNWQSTSVAADTNRHTYILDKTTYSIYTNGTQIHSGSNAYTITKNGTHSLLLLACYNDSTAQSIMEHTSAKLYSCKIWDNGTLVRDFVPVIRNSDNKPGMYDIVTDTFYTNAGTGEFNYKKYPESGKIQKIYMRRTILPSTYQRVEYIQSSGTQYIDSGVTIGSSTNNEIIEGKIQFNSNSSAQVNGKNQKKVLFFGTNASNVFYGGIGDNYGNTSLTNDGNTHIFKISQSEYKLYVDGTGYTLTSTAFSGDIYSSNIYIGAASDAYIGAARFHCKENIYYFKIWQGGSLVRDFIPCYRISDGVIGLYDTVNGQFYTNAGTGTFTKGADVSTPVMKEYQIRPGLSEHTVVYDDIPFKTEYLIAKSGYNIKQIILEWSAHYSLTSWQINQIFLTSPSNDNLRLRTDGQLGGTYGYDYREGIGKYVGQTFDVNSSANHYSVFASPNSSYAGTYDNAGYVTITKDTVDYKIGQTYGTWLWTGTTTLSAQLKGYMETLLNSDDIFCKRNTWDSNDLFTYYKVTVTYEPV